AFIWLTMSVILGFLSGWYSLMIIYPDRQDEVLLQAQDQSGSMGLWIGMSGILHISVCRSGLRIGILRIFGIFCRNFFVPWPEIRIQRKDYFSGAAAELKFGNPAIGRLTIRASLADRLARSAKGHWPEPEKPNLEQGPFPRKTDKQFLARLTKRWLLL